MNSFGMASLLKIICLLQRIKLMYIMMFHSFMCQCTLVHKNMHCSKPKHQHIDFTIKEKLEILNKLACGVKAINLCKLHNSSQSTLSTWKKQKDKLKEIVEAGKVLDTKRNHESFLFNIKRALHIWFGKMIYKPHTPLLNKQVLAKKAT